MRQLFWSAVVATLAVSCQRSPVSALDELARDYVLLTLALDARDPGYVESFYGPEGERAEAERRFETTASIGFEASRASTRLTALELETEVEAHRAAFLGRQLASLRARVDALQGVRMRFDDETRARYGGAAPKRSEAELARQLEPLAALLDGDGSLGERLSRHERRYLVPEDRLEIVFRAAIEECRRRASEHVELPRGERYRLELVHGKPWAAYSWYRGDYESLIQLNVGSRLTIDAMVDLACHEVYPGHHLMQVLLESRVVRPQGFWEYSVMPLYSPLSAQSEGLAEIGVELAFPDGERRRFERDVLFPMAGLDPGDYDQYESVRRETRRLRGAHVETARRYFDGELTRRDAARWLREYALVSDPEQALRYLTVYRSRIASYDVGEQRVRAALGARSGSEQWDRFEALLLNSVH